jgi:hypothetical protein
VISRAVQAGQALLLLLLGLGHATAQDASLEQALQAARVVPPATVAFEELRYSSLLQEPLRLSGHMELLPDGSLRKQVESPFRETITFDGRDIRVQRDSQPARTLGAGSRQLRKLLNGFRALLGGDAAQLDKDFETTTSGTVDDWQLLLKPRQTTRHLRSISIRGSRDTAESIDIDQGPGERSLVTLQHAP